MDLSYYRGLISDFTKPSPLKLKVKSLATKLQSEPMFEEEDSFQLLENITMPVQERPSSGLWNQPIENPNDTIQTNLDTVELFKL